MKAELLDTKRRPFHELSEDEFNLMQYMGLKWSDVARNFSQPSWCNYPGGLDGIMGCWSLIGRMVTGRDYCKNCELSADFEPPPTTPPPCGSEGK